jgi:hypothetical protein
MVNLTGRQAQIAGWCRSRWLGLWLVGSVFVVATVLSWRKWPDILVDYGMQLYLPWRISEGDVLYRDMMYLTGGPLSQYFNALLFKLFGVSFRTLIFANLTITAGLLVLVYRRFLAAADQLTATMIGLGIVLVFAFQHYELNCNYNYVTPYSHEVFHGLVLSIVVVAWLSDWVDRRQVRYAVAAGLGSGLVFLTKPDVFLALAVCIAAAGLVVCVSSGRVGFMVKSVLGFLAAGVVPLLGFYGYFLGVEDWRSSLRGVLGAWMPLWHTSITQDPFYQWCLGLDVPFMHLEKMAVYGMLLLVVTGIYAWAYRGDVGSRFKWLGRPWLVMLVPALPLMVLGAAWSWMDCGRVLPLLGMCTCVLLAVNYWKGGLAGGVLIFPLLWNIFGVALLAKLGFFPRIWHYGFALAMPAFAGSVYLFVWLLPVWLERRYQVRFDLFRVTACLVLATGMGHLFWRSESYYLRKTVAVGGGGDRIMAYGAAEDPFHGNVEVALRWMETNAPRGATLAVLPEGAMINYLGRRVNPTRYPVWLPPELKVFGQTNMSAAFEISSPEYVVILNRSLMEYGVGYFGYDPHYGTDLAEWMSDHYDRVYPAPGPGGESPFDREAYSELQILKRRAAILPAGKN